MLQLTTRKTTYQTKPNWFDYTEEMRELGTQKSVLDIISNYCEFNEDTHYFVYRNEIADENLVCEFTNEKFQKEETGLGLFTAQKIVRAVEIYEEKIATGLKITIKRVNEETKKEETQEKAEILLKKRIVKIVF